MPAWVEAGFQEYARRMPREAAVELVEIRPERRPSKTLTPAAIRKLQASEGQRMRAALPASCLSVALDAGGKSFSTEKFADVLQGWLQGGRDVAFLIGGADGLDVKLKQDAALVLSLSSMTLPHQLVRVLLAEQLYRGMSLLRNHPYHRG